MSLAAEAPARSLASRILHATPVLGHIARDVSRDISTIYYLLTILVTLIVLGVKTWGLAALVLPAVAFVPVMFVLLIWITLP
ncbi:hypothetical protein [Paragemmobacter ruber]|uniref:Uncharacterized protein n=1 Tax=Paragemmobacter ruber TaxID=1985673 RepID=A0ABW9Y6E9_9RHOB|nr:hypothetical protein [Rhodobacter ruber]NBE08121.1 hypothetical protein [Rhodobacter ruber]